MSHALQLARLRATHGATLGGGDIEAVAADADALGRRLVELAGPGASRAFVLGWLDGREPPVGDDGISVRRLSPIPILTFACCLRLCWPDPSASPYPGEPTIVDEVVTAAVTAGADERHVKSALRNDLRSAGLVDLRGSDLRLGPAVAAWAPAQIEALRRFHSALPHAGVPRNV